MRSSLPPTPKQIWEQLCQIAQDYKIKYPDIEINCPTYQTVENVFIFRGRDEAAGMVDSFQQSLNEQS